MTPVAGVAAGLAWARARLGRTWLIVSLGVVYAVSQTTILLIARPLRDRMLELQCLGFTAERTRAILLEWQAAGLLPAYRAHFVFDDVHWLWYAGFSTALLCRLFERARLPHRLDWLLLLPLVSGLCDAYENALQHVYLVDPGFATVVDPLPLLGTLASNVKWALAAVYVGLAVVLLVRKASATSGTSE